MVRATGILKLLFIAGILIAGGPPEAAAQRQRGVSRARSQMNRIMQNVQKDIAAVQKQLNEAQTELRIASQDLKSAQEGLKSAGAEVERARKSQVERFGPKVGLPDAVAAAHQAHADYDAATARAVTRLQSTPKFQEVKQTRDEAAARVEALKKEHASHDKIAEASKSQLQASEAYRSLLDHDPQVKPVREHLTQVESRLAEVRAKFHQASKEDSELHSAETLVKQSKQALEKAKASFAAAEQKVALLQSRLMADHQLIGR